ncbi:UNVERIFIED_CONTAM: hypothetical protein Slati_4435100 [Sesamum latifolium]|uniref:RNase H type-1 domain-containing protein n=1 Tax=Sesamum latifolium TaxID=2727402 RepID=A0AAW2SQG8_9LAMI
MALALVVTARRLCPYFLSHPIGVKTNLLLKQTLEKSDTSGRLVKWVVELSEYDISYLPRTTIKAQALANFISEMAGISLKDFSKVEKWLLHMDGSSTIQGSSAGIVITSPQGEDLEFAVKFGFKALTTRQIKQVEGTYEAKEENMIQYLQQIAELKSFDCFKLIQIPREENVKDDFLSKLANSLEGCRTRHITIQYNPDARAPLTVQAITAAAAWRAPVIRWLEE